MSTPRRSSSTRLLPGALVLLAGLAAPAAADVLVVDAAGGGDFTSLPTALANAQDGDTLLVRAGNYTTGPSDLVVFARSLTIAADGSGPVVTGPIRILNTAGQHVVLRGLTVGPVLQAAQPDGLRVTGGDVLAESCSFRGRDGEISIGGVAGYPGVRIDSGRVVLRGCTVEGGRGKDSFFPYIPIPTAGGPGVQALGGTLAIHASLVTGGRGGDFVGFDGDPGPGGNGAIGIRAVNDLTFIAGSTVRGGDGGNGDETTPSPGQYEGGSAVLAPSLAAVWLLDDTLVPGAGGLDGNGQPGPSGLTLGGGDPGLVVEFPGPYRHYSIGAPTPEGDSVQVSYTGVAGDVLLIFASLQPGSLSLPGKQGLWHLGSPLFGPYVMAAPSGSLALSVPVPPVGLGPEGALLLYEQVFVKPASGPALLSSPTTHLIVDGSL